MAETWFHEYGFSGPEDFESAVAAIEGLGFRFVYGGATKDESWVGYPAEYDKQSSALAAAEARAVRAEAALAKYGRHGTFCSWNDGASFCDCGLLVLAGQEGKP